MLAPEKPPTQSCGLLIGIVRAEMERRKWDEKSLAERRKGDKVKVELAERLRRETMRTLRWIQTKLGSILILHTGPNQHSNTSWSTPGFHKRATEMEAKPPGADALQGKALRHAGTSAGLGGK